LEKRPVREVVTMTMIVKRRAIRTAAVGQFMVSSSLAALPLLGVHLRR
jgi:hypothetical protein